MREATAEYSAPSWPQAARVFVKEFELEATKAGANDEDLGYIHRVLTSPESYVMYHGGNRRDMTDEELLKQMGFLAAGLRAWLRGRIRDRSSSR